MSLITAKATKRDLAHKAQAVVDSPDMTAAEKAAALDALDVDMKKADDEIRLYQRISTMVPDSDGDTGDGDKPHAKSWADQLADAPLVKGFRKGNRIAGEVDLKDAGPILEGTAQQLNGSNGPAGAVLIPQQVPGIVGLTYQPLYIADLCAQGQVGDGANGVSYVVQTAFQDGTAATPEGGAKPYVDVAFTRRQDNLTKIANFAKTSDEMVEDANQLVSFIQNMMLFGIKREEERELLSGSGTSPELQGILNRAGLMPAVTPAGKDPSDIVDAIFRQITAIRLGTDPASAYVEPDAIVINPADWAVIRLAKDKQGQYLAGGPYGGSYGNTTAPNVDMLWGRRVVITNAVPQGTILIGGFAECAQVWRRNGITVEMTNSNEDDFRHDLVALRAYERVALAVYRPAGFGVVKTTPAA